MKQIIFAKDYLKICDYNGYFNGKTYYIHKTTKGYVASTGGIYCKKFIARTLKDLSTQLNEAL